MQGPDGLATLIAAYDAAISRLRGLATPAAPHWPTAMRTLMGRFLYGRAMAKWDGSLTGDIADFDAAIDVFQAIRNTMGTACPLGRQQELASALEMRGNAKAAHREFAGAVDDYNAAIDLINSIYDAAPEDRDHATRDNDARLLMNRGLYRLLCDVKQPGNIALAIEDYTAAISIRLLIRNEMGESWTASFQYQLATTYSNLARARLLSGDKIAARAAIANALAIQERVVRNWASAYPQYYRDVLANMRKLERELEPLLWKCCLPRIYWPITGMEKFKFAVAGMTLVALIGCNWSIFLGDLLRQRGFDQDNLTIFCTSLIVTLMMGLQFYRLFFDRARQKHE